MIEYRVMNPEDVPAGLSLCRSAGWNQLKRDWDLFLQVSPGGCRVAVKDGKVIGTVTTIKYQRSFCWIGMVLVDPGSQRQGIGKQLLQEAFTVLQDEETVKLDATPAGREVYLKLNFTDEYRLSRMHAIAPGTGLEEATAIPMQESDLPEIARFDREIFGADRRFLLEWMWEGAPRFCYLIKSINGVQGYCLARTGYNFIDIGPVVAVNTTVAKNLVSSALKNCTGKSVILDALHFDPEWIKWLTYIGFTEQRQLTRMYRGKNNFPGVPEKQFSILGPEFG